MTIAQKAKLDFGVERIDVVQLDIARRPDGLLAGHDLMSPYVWRNDGRTCLLVRVLERPARAR
jgi:beta-1,2-mannobiose phosphorylase / 1,2-beta-oligomannan phosphorylase